MIANKTLLQKISQEANENRPIVCCTIIETSGSTPQVPGAMMLIDHNGAIHGTIGGGCVEAEIRRQGFQMIGGAGSEVVSISLGNDSAGEEGLICGGDMKIAILPISEMRAATPFTTALEDLSKGLATQLRIDVQVDGKPFHYLIPLEPEPMLVIAGAGHIGIELAALAQRLEFAVTVVDTRADYVSAERFPDPVKRVVGEFESIMSEIEINPATYLVIVTRGHKFDQTVLGCVAGKPAKYIGMVGSRRKVQVIIENLITEGLSKADLEKVHAPIGIPINSITVPEIAVSIAGQLIKVRRAAGKQNIEGPFAS